MSAPDDVRSARPAGPRARLAALTPLAVPAYAVPALLAAAGLVAVVLAVEVPGAPASSPAHDVRAVVTTLFLLLGPGWAVAGFLRGATTGRRAVVAVGTGLAIGIVAGQAMAVAGAWHPVGLMIVLAAVSVPVLVRHAVRAP